MPIKKHGERGKLPLQHHRYNRMLIIEFKKKLNFNCSKIFHLILLIFRVDDNYKVVIEWEP